LGHGMWSAPFTYIRFVVVGICLVITGCSGMESGGGEEIEEQPELDETLADLITFQGQRSLLDFAFPESDDFGSIPQDPNNPLSADKVELGALLFHETALATNPVKPEAAGTYSCATCHHAGAGFQAGILQGIGEGGSGWGQNGEGRRAETSYAPDEVDIQLIRTPSVLNTAYQEVMGWAGSFGVRGPNRGSDILWEEGTLFEVNKLGYDGLESQAIAALMRHRMDSLENSIVATDPTYQALWEAVFPGEPVTTELVGLAIAAYERTLLANRAPFQRWLKGERMALSAAEKRGAIVYFSKGDCETCHTGPSLNQMDFYALGMPDMPGATEDIDILGRGAYVRVEAEEYKFKVPQLYNLKDNPFYGHGGTFRSIREVVEYYNDGIPAVDLPAGRLPDQFVPLELTDDEIDDLTLFLTESLYDPDLDRYAKVTLPSGNCTPANDAQAKRDLGC